MDSNRKLSDNDEINNLKTLLHKQQGELEDFKVNTQGQLAAIFTLL